MKAIIRGGKRQAWARPNRWSQTVWGGLALWVGAGVAAAIIDQNPPPWGCFPKDTPRALIQAQSDLFARHDRLVISLAGASLFGMVMAGSGVVGVRLSRRKRPPK
jgi:hypothetical protein